MPAGPLLAAALASGLPFPAAAQVSPNGPELQVNLFTTGVQRFASVAVDGRGNFVVAWESYGSSGTDTSLFSIQARSFGANGAALGGQFQVNTYTTDEQVRPVVAADGQGNFVVAWQSYGSSGGDTSSDSIQAQRYAADGTPLGGPFQVNTYTTDRQRFPSVAMNDQGSFVVAWESEGSSGTDTSYSSVQAQRYAANGTPLGGELQVNTYTTGHQRVPSVAVDGLGNFVVAWESGGSSGGDTSGYSVQARRFAANGSPLGGQFQVNTYTTFYQQATTVSVDDQGDFVVAWQSAGSSGTDTSLTSIQAQRYAANGTPVGGQFQVNTYTTGSQVRPSVAVDGQGNFVVSWDSPGSSGGDTSADSIQAQRYAANGAPLGGQFQVNSYTTSSQTFQSVATDDEGNAVVTWQSFGSNGPDTSDWGIVAQRYDQLFRDGFESNDTGRWSATAP